MTRHRRAEARNWSSGRVGGESGSVQRRSNGVDLGQPQRRACMRQRSLRGLMHCFFCDCAVTRGPADAQLRAARRAALFCAAGCTNLGRQPPGLPVAAPRCEMRTGTVEHTGVTAAALPATTPARPLLHAIDR